jgi:hypothetical protein
MEHTKFEKEVYYTGIIRECHVGKLPTKYVRTVIVEYTDGVVIEIDGGFLTDEYITLNPSKWKKLETDFRKIEDIKIVFDSLLLGEYVEKEIAGYFKNL